MDFVLSIEEAYGIQLSLEEIMSMHTVSDILEIVNSRVN
jgi:acyl carrier protein